MNDLIVRLWQFGQHHWALSLSLVAVVGLIIFEEFKSRVGIRTVTLQEGVLMVNRGEGIFVDVRSSDQFKAVHIAGAINLPKDELSSQLDKLRTYQQKTILLIGEPNTNLVSVSKQLKAVGQVVFLAGGMLAWQEAQLPVVKAK